jgi:hypothetical protein
MVTTDAVNNTPEQANEDRITGDLLPATLLAIDAVDNRLECTGCGDRFTDPVSKEHHEFQCANTGECKSSDSENQAVDRALQHPDVSSPHL